MHMIGPKVKVTLIHQCVLTTLIKSKWRLAKGSKGLAFGPAADHSSYRTTV